MSLLLGSVRPGRPAALARAGALVLAVFALFTWAAAPASAHAALQETTPADGSTLDTPPEQVSFRFNESMLGFGVTVRVTGPGGSVTTGKATVKAKVVTQRLQPDLVPGVYRVAWRVASKDGHPISGTSRFTIAAADLVPTPTPAASPSLTPTPAVTASLTPTASLNAEDTAATTGDSALPLVVAGGVGVIAVAVAVTGVVLLRRRRP